MLNTVKNFIHKFLLIFICIPFNRIVVEVMYGGFWQFRSRASHGKLGKMIYYAYVRANHFFIDRDTQFDGVPTLPHGLNGIHVSTMAKIGKNVTLFQQVTIGSNTITGHPKYGAPTIGDNVYIGAGAKIIGAVTIGENCRIGANATVVKDMAPNTIAVSPPTRFIISETTLENNFNKV